MAKNFSRNEAPQDRNGPMDQAGTHRIVTALNAKKTGYIFDVYARNIAEIALRVIYRMDIPPYRSAWKAHAYYMMICHGMMNSKPLEDELKNLLRYGIHPDTDFGFQQLFIMTVPEERIRYMRMFGHDPTVGYLALGDTYKPDKVSASQPITSVGKFDIQQERSRQALRKGG